MRNILIFTTFFLLMGCQNKQLVIWAIGDSNGASEHGWVTQLKKLRPDDRIINFSIGGNTIGFNNLDREELNTLTMLDQYLNQGMDSIQGKLVDVVLINLGTNDCKKVFDSQLTDVPENMNTLIHRIKDFGPFQKKQPRIVVVSPPPYGVDSLMAEKYQGGEKRIQFVVPAFEKVAEQNNAGFVNVYEVLKPVYQQLAPDGIHMKEEGQMIIAQKINDYLKEYD